MSAAINANPVINSSKVAFCDKNCKGIRVMADKVSKKCVEIFYRVISAICSLFSSRLAHRYACLAQLEQEKNHWSVTYHQYGDKIVDFASNTFTHIKTKLPEGVSELQGIKNLYGADKIDRLCRKFPEELLEHLGRGDGGCCYGMSMDFISSYLHQKQAGKGTLEAVKEIAPQFENGASDNAEICQIFFDSSLDFVVSQVFDNAQEKIAEAQEKASIWVQNEKAKLVTQAVHEHWTDEQMLEKCKLIKAEVLRRKAELKEQLFVEYYNTAAENYSKISSTVQIVASPPLLIKSNINASQLERATNDLPVRVYGVFVSGSDPEREGAWAHSVVYIKTGEGQDIIFDPNEATFVIESDQSSAQLWDAIEGLHRKGENHSVVFMPYHIA